jgi:hypothetical protein
MAVKKRLGQMLIEAGVIDQAQLQAALGYQRQWGGRLGHALVEMKLATEPRIVEALADKFGYEVVRPGALDSGPLLESALALIPREFAIRNNVMAYEADTSTISIATADPANIAVLDEVQFRTGRRVKVALAGENALAEALRRFYGGGDERLDGIALDPESDAPAEAIATDSFGGGSTAELEQFFTSDPNPPAPVAPQPPRAAPLSRTAVPALPLPSEVISGEVLEPTPTPTPLPVHLESLRPREEVRPRPSPPAAPATPASAEPVIDGIGGEDGEPLLVTELVSEEAAPPPEAPAPPAKPSGEPALRDEDLALLASLEQLAKGAAPGPALTVKPTQLLAALVHLLIRKKVISEREFIEELHRK